ncbi:hypothetical protein BKA63DRAFT_197689 [Paraphoma chrysanthemicola]|nr:hypothetical protein BKA63DRAFT_227936 [Paraphoma chrysanthemicola]KAH7061845.1 hypothetical protein BKA63DRAFT_197689 [Paraphoma chrysanthemicola]
MKWASWPASAKSCPRLSPFWCFCFLAGVAKFLFAILSVVAASIVQKLAVLMLHMALFRRGRFVPAVVLESIFSDWSESCLVVVAVLKRLPAVAYNHLIGFVAVKYFLLLGVCSFYLGRRQKEISYPRLTGLIHTRLLVLSVSIMPLLTAAQWTIPKSEQNVALLCHITASVVLLLFIGHHRVVYRTHSKQARRAYRVSTMVSPASTNAQSDEINRRPLFSISSRMAERIQDCRDIHIDSISKPCSWPASHHNSGGDGTDQNNLYRGTKDNTVISIIFVTACVIILVSSYHLVDAIAPKGPEHLNAPQQFGILLITLLVGLTESIAVCVERWRLRHCAVAEEVLSFALGSTARLLTALLSVSTLVGWTIGAGASMLPVAAFHCALLGVALVMHIVGEGWIAGSILLTLYLLFAAGALLQE